jgi:hypothetical protein
MEPAALLTAEEEKEEIPPSFEEVKIPSEYSTCVDA